MTASSRDSDCPNVEAECAGGRPAGGQHGSVSVLFSQLRGCDPAVLGEVWRRFFPRMAGLARRTLAGLPRCGVEADDVAQSAFVSFWQALDGGADFDFGDRNDLWKLLAVITARKARKRTRRQMAKKRGASLTLRGSEFVPDEAEAGSPSTWGELSPPEFDLLCEELLLNLDADERSIAILRMQGFSSDEIASRVGCSARTIQRRLEAIWNQWKGMLAAE